MSGSIHRAVLSDASAGRMYDVLSDAARCAAFTGAPAEISAEPGGAFSCFGGMITGRNIEFIPGKCIRPGMACRQLAARHVFDRALRAQAGR